jgi:hypothetical protein
MANKAVFTIATGFTKAYTLAIHAFTVAVTWLFHISEHINIAFDPQIGVKFTLSISSKTVRITISKTSLIGKLVVAVSLKKIRIAITSSATMKAVVAIVNKIAISAYTKVRQKITVALSARRISLALSPTVAAFYTLATYDPSTLGDLDGSTLGTLDYTV